MLRGRIGLVGLASRFESGGERAESILTALKTELEKNGTDVSSAGKVIWDMADAVEVAGKMALASIDALVLVHLSWVQDSIQYILQSTVKKPVLLWALPFAETFSAACVQHFGSVLTARGIPFEYVSALPDNEVAVKAVVSFARAATAAAQLRAARIGMIGPRQTFRITGPQDTTVEEWDLTEQFGLRIVHIGMNELRCAAAAITDESARALLEAKKAATTGFRFEADEARLLFASKVTLAVKHLYARYGLTAASAQCYPANGGITNLASSWLADEGIVLDTEGDIGHTALLLLMNWLGSGEPAMLAETGKLDDVGDCLHFVHEGSAAMSLAESGGVVQAAAEEGTAVGFRLKAMPQLTVASLCGYAGNYRMLLSKAASIGMEQQDWLDAGRKFHGRLRFAIPATQTFNELLRKGVDHHIVARQGDCLSDLACFCRITGVKTLCLSGCD